RTSARGAFAPRAAARTSADTRGIAPIGAIGSAASTIGLRSLPASSSSTSTRSPGSTGRELAGVPVRMMSPGSSVRNRERSATSRPKGKMKFAVESSWTSSPFTYVRSVSAAGSTSPAGTSVGPTGVNPSWPFAKTFEPRSAQRRSYTPKSFEAANHSMHARPSSGVTPRARRPTTAAISPSYVNSSHPCGRTTGWPSQESDDGGFRKYDGTEGKRPRSSARARKFVWTPKIFDGLRPSGCSKLGLREQRAHALDARLAVVRGHHRARHPDRVAEEEVLVERLSAGEGREARVPREPEQPHAVRPVESSRLHVALDVLLRRPEHVGLGRERHQPARAELSEDLGEALRRARIPVAAGVQRLPLRRHHAEAVRLRVDDRRPDEGLHRLERDDDLREALLHVLELLDADRLADERREPEHELRLRGRPRRDLVRHVHGRRRPRVELVAELRVPEHEAALVRDEDVVEDHDRVDLLEARAERVVEVAAPVVERLAADEAQAERVARDRDGERVRAVLGRALQHRRREDEQLVGDRPDRREDARAADRHAVVVLLDHVGHDRAAELLRRRHAPVRLRRHERVREEQVLLAHLLVVAARV